jgi:hypothetical protein
MLVLISLAPLAGRAAVAGKRAEKPVERARVEQTNRELSTKMANDANRSIKTPESILPPLLPSESGVHAVESMGPRPLTDKLIAPSRRSLGSSGATPVSRHFKLDDLVSRTVEPRQELVDLLKFMFPNDAIRWFIAYSFGPMGRELASFLPEGKVSQSELVDSSVDLLRRHGLMDAELVEKLMVVAPFAVGRIARVFQEFQPEKLSPEALKTASATIDALLDTLIKLAPREAEGIKRAVADAKDELHSETFDRALLREHIARMLRMGRKSVRDLEKLPEVAEKTEALCKAAGLAGC